MKYRPYIVKSLWAAGLLLIVLVAAGGVWGLLAVVGDESGAAGAKAIALVTLACSILNFIVLVVLLALTQLTSNSDDRE